MAHPNDTLNGILLAWERPEEAELRSKLGYWRLVEKRMIRKELIAEGFDPNALEFEFLIEKRVGENHQNDPTFKEQQDTVRKLAPPIQTTQLFFSLEELARLAEHFVAANDPVTQEIYRKACIGINFLKEHHP